MKNLFNILKLQALILALGLMTVSCKDDDENVTPGNSDKTNTEFNNQKFTMKNGFYQNIGAMDYYYDEDATEKTHYNSMMFITDGTPVIKNEEIESMNDGKVVILASMMSPGNTPFKAGTYEFTNWIDDITDVSNEDMTMDEFDDKYRNKAFIPLGLVIVDSDGDKNWEEETGLDITGGTLKVSGTSPNFTTEYDLTLEGGKTIKGSFAGKFNQIQ